MLSKNVKVKVFQEQATKAQKGSRCIVHSVFNLGAGWSGGGQRHTPIALPAGKNQCPLYRRLGGARSLSGQNMLSNLLKQYGYYRNWNFQNTGTVSSNSHLQQLSRAECLIMSSFYFIVFQVVSYLNFSVNVTYSLSFWRVFLYKPPNPQFIIFCSVSLIILPNVYVCVELRRKRHCPRSPPRFIKC
jgi:hypothetical protein